MCFSGRLGQCASDREETGLIHDLQFSKSDFASCVILGRICAIWINFSVRPPLKTMLGRLLVVQLINLMIMHWLCLCNNPSFPFLNKLRHVLHNVP